MINRKKFFDFIRKPLFGGKMSALQVAGIEATLDEWDFWVSKKWTDDDIRKLAYIFATDYHEGSKTMQPIKEKGSNAYFIRKYWDNLKLRKELGNIVKQDAIDFSGGGKPQTTGRGNYAKMGKILGYDLVKNPKLVLDLKISTEIMFEGMLTGKSFKGDFTGKSLTNYFNKTTEDPFNARKIINSLDKAKLIEEYYWIFKSALS